jgi:hypothetical protein
MSLNDDELKVEGAAVNFSTVSNLSLNLGTSNLLKDSNIEFVSRPERHPNVVNFSVLSHLNAATPEQINNKSNFNSNPNSNPGHNGQPPTALAPTRPEARTAQLIGHEQSLAQNQEVR